MADNERSYQENTGENIPVTGAPTRSQTNLASRAPGPERRSIEQTHSFPQPAAKPPPDVTAVSERRRITDAAPAVVEYPEPPTWVNAEVCEATHEPARRRSLRKIGAECLIVLICVLTGILARSRLGHPVMSPTHDSAARPGGPRTSPVEPLRGLPDDAGEAFTTALNDLDDAMEEFPQQSPERLLEKASVPGHDCLLLWHGDYASVVFGKMPSPPNSLAAGLEGCARAVKQLPR
jgi:hypothetical protein